MNSWLADLVLAWPPVAPAALAAVSAAVIVVLAKPGCLGRHVYDELLEDVLKRTRANGWEREEAAPAVPSSTPDAPDSIVGESDWRLEEAVRDAAARAEREVARVRQEAELALEHALELARADADRERAAAVREAEAAAAAELARVKQEAERTLAAKLQEARTEIADVRKEAEAALAQARADDAAELARVKQETATAAADVVPVAPKSPTRKQTLEEHIREARAKLVERKQDPAGQG